METEAKDVAPVAYRPRIGVVILTWNDTTMTRRCLRHVLASNDVDLDVLLVDNGSAEPCGRTLAAEFPSVELLELPKNKGFAGGGNIGIRCALERGAKYVLHLNNDAFVAPDAIARLVREMEAHPDIGMAHPMLLYPDEDRVQFYDATVDRDMARHDHHHVGAVASARHWPVVDSPFVPACVVVYRAAALETVGGYDESLGTSWEDYDLCLRFADAGWRIVTVGEARAEHYSGQTTGRVSPYIIYHMTRNRLVCIGRYADKKEVWRRLPYLLRSFTWDIRRHGLLYWAGHRSFLLGIWDYLRGNYGENPNHALGKPGTHGIKRAPAARS